MKTIGKFCFLVTLAALGYGQKNIVEFSVGRTFYGSGDFFGSNLTGVYQAKVTKNFYLYSSINQSAGVLQTSVSEELSLDYPTPFIFLSNKSSKLCFGPSFKLLPQKINSFSFEILGSLNHSKYLMNPSGYLRNPDPSAPADFRLLTLPMIYERNLGFGGMAQVGYRLRLPNDFGIGLDYNIWIDNSGNGERNFNFVFRKAF